MQENEVKFGKKSEIFQNHGFSIEISEATVRDFDLIRVHVKVNP